MKTAEDAKDEEEVKEFRWNGRELLNVKGISDR